MVGGGSVRAVAHIPDSPQSLIPNLMRRHLVGILGLALIAAWIVLEIKLRMGHEQSAVEADFEGAASRIGGFLIILWLAWDQLKRIPNWLWLVLPAIAAAFLFRRPQILVLLIPILIAVAILRPRNKPPKMRRRRVVDEFPESTRP
jgi:4-amino-4-deoxy-L-arabinose transferase-like glycosyltransferase